MAPEDNESMVQRLAPARGIGDPNVARCFEPVADTSGRLWLVEEWVDGVSLGALTEEHTLSAGQALGVARGLLGGLAAAHAAGVAHGLASPATVMLDLTGAPRLVDTGAWVADPTVAETDDFAAPEVVAGAPPDRTSDVFSAGKVIEELLAGAGAAQGHLGTVVARATATEPAARQQDAGVLLAELSQEAERAYGPLWWTLEGVGSAVASAIGVGAGSTATATGVAAVGQAGMVSGSLDMGGAAVVAGADAGTGGAGAVRATVKTGSKLRVLIPVVVGGVVIVGLGIAAANAARPPAGSQGAAEAPVLVTTPTPTASLTPTPSPTPTPPLALGFNGDYTWTSVLTKSNLPRIKVGGKSTETRTVTTTCDQGVCTTVIQVGDRSVPATQTAEGWTQDDRYSNTCIDLGTGKTISTNNPVRSVRNLAVDKVVDGKIVRLVGTSHYSQLKKCKNQTEKLMKLTYKVTMTLKE